MQIAGAVVLLAVLAPAFSLFVTATALPSILADIGGLALYAWATIAYSVSSIVGSASSSAVARRRGSRGGLVIANALFVFGSAVCATASSMSILVAGRAVQGVGGGMVVGVVHAMIREVFPAHLWPRMLATISVAWGVAALTGPFVGGVLAQVGLWRAGFWGTIPFVAINRNKRGMTLELKQSEGGGRRLRPHRPGHERGHERDGPSGRRARQGWHSDH